MRNYLRRRFAAPQFQAKSQCNCCRHSFCIFHGGQVDKAGAIRVDRRHALGDLQRQPRLADARRAGEREQAALVAGQPPADEIDVVPAPHEGRWRGRQQVVGRRVNFFDGNRDAAGHGHGNLLSAGRACYPQLPPGAQRAPRRPAGQAPAQSARR